MKLYFGAIQVLRNTDGGGGCQIFRKKVLQSSAGSILDISKYRDTCERSISILGGIAILRYIEYMNDQSDDTWAIYKYRVSNEISSIV